MSVVGKDGIFKLKEGEAWKQYNGMVCRALEYDDESQTGIIVIFRDGQKLTIASEEFELLTN